MATARTFNYMNENILACEAHGQTNYSALQGPTGELLPAEDFARRYIAPAIRFAMNTEKHMLPADEPLLLIACYAGKNGAAREMTHAACRPLDALDKAIYVPHHVDQLRLSAIFAKISAGEFKMGKPLR